MPSSVSIMTEKSSFEWTTANRRRSFASVPSFDPALESGGAAGGPGSSITEEHAIRSRLGRANSKAVCGRPDGE